MAKGPEVPAAVPPHFPRCDPFSGPKLGGGPGFSVPLAPPTTAAPSIGAPSRPMVPTPTMPTTPKRGAP